MFNDSKFDKFAPAAMLLGFVATLTVAFADLTPSAPEPQVYTFEKGLTIQATENGVVQSIEKLKTAWI